MKWFRLWNTIAFSFLSRQHVQHICLHGNHIAYYNGDTKSVHCGRIRQGKVQEMFRQRFLHVSNLDMCENDQEILMAVAKYYPRENNHGVELVQIDSTTGAHQPYAFPSSVRHSTFIRSCSFVQWEQGLSLVCWSIDGIRSVHLLGSPTWIMEPFSFHLHHVTVSENSIGVLDHDSVFHLFHPDGTYRNKTIERESQSPSIVTACHFSLPSRKLAICFSDGTLRVYGAHRDPYTRCFHQTIRHVYADTQRFLLFFENGHVVMGKMNASLSIVKRWFHLCDAGCMQRFAVQPPFLVMDADKEGLFLRRFAPAAPLASDQDDFWKNFFGSGETSEPIEGKK